MIDIFAAQGGDPDALAELYDLEHDERREDHVFYREFARRARGAILDLGCGSGRLFRALAECSRRRVVGVDGSPALLRRAQRRIDSDIVLREGRAARRLETALGDVTSIRRAERFSLIVAVDVVPHLGEAATERMLRSAAAHLTEAGKLIVDLAGPGALPQRDLRRGLDWDRDLNGGSVRRWSALRRLASDRGLTVMLSTTTERRMADGTIARLPAAFRLWYPDRALLERLVARAGLIVSMTYGSHELDDPGPRSERLIAVTERPGRHRIR
ncbi:MAG: class I SAM-dependent methyltransferase [Candidatus Limnocylindria bacterium]